MVNTTYIGTNYTQKADPIHPKRRTQSYFNISMIADIVSMVKPFSSCIVMT